MQATSSSRYRSIAQRVLLAGAMLAAGVAGSPVTTASARPTAGVSLYTAMHPTPATGPRLVRGAVADALVQVQGGTVCSGTPITGTRYVVTAAHCVLDRQGNAAARTVVRHGVTYTAEAVLVDDRYVEEPTAQLDAALLVMDQIVPGGSATIGAAIPTTGSVTIAGFQALDSDGTLLRGRGPHDRLVPKGATGSVIEIESAPAGCTAPSVSLSVIGGRVDIRCGLIPGASGGGLFTEVNGTLVLVGIVSTVTFDLSVNGVVPLESLHELLRHQDEYWHEVNAQRRTGDVARAVLS